MKITKLLKTEYQNFKALFTAYYKELDCADDAENVLNECVLPDFEADILDVLLAFDGDTAIGFVIFQIDDITSDWNYMEGDGDIREIYVTPTHRKKGVGKALLLTAEDVLLKAGAEEVYALPTHTAECFFVACEYNDTDSLCCELDCGVFVKALK